MGQGETDDAVELAPFVALRAALGAFGLAGAELAEVLGRFGRGVGEEFHFDAAEGFTCGLCYEWEVLLSQVEVRLGRRRETGV